MSLPLLSLLKEFSARRGLPTPTIVMASQDDQLLQLVGLLNEVLEDLTTRYVGTALQKTATWDLKPAESQGLLHTLCPYGFKWIINDTFWDRSQQLPVRGPLSPQEWQQTKATMNSGVWLQFRIVGGELLLNGALTTGHKLALEYASDWSVKAIDGVTWRARFEKDDDVCSFPTSVLLAGLNWKWRLEKGLKYSEAFRSYEVALTEFNGHDGSKPMLSMDGGALNPKPGIMIPTGNWKL